MTRKFTAERRSGTFIGIAWRRRGNEWMVEAKCSHGHKSRAAAERCAKTLHKEVGSGD